MTEPVKAGDEVIYQLRRWQVVLVTSQEQSPDYAVPRVPDQLRLLRGSVAVSAAADQVVQATPGKP